MPGNGGERTPAPPPESPARSPTGAPSLLQRLQTRKVFHWGVAYLAGAWLLLQLLGLLGDFFGWPSVVGRIAVVLLALGFLGALLLAWYHGEKGAQRVSAVEVALLVVLAVIAGVGVTLVAGFRGRDSRGSPGARAIAPDSSYERSLAVLPFESMSADPGDAYLAGGFHEELITTLSQLPGLTVISRTSVMGYRGTTKNVREVARELGVSRILEGSVQKANGRIRVTAQLVDARTDRHLWAASYDRDLKDVFAIQSELASRIADALRARITPAQKSRLQKPPTRDQEAYALYLRAGGMLGTRTGVDSAIALLREAVRLDPSFAGGYARLAGTYASLNEWYGAGRQWSDSSLAAAQRALALDPSLPEAHRAYGLALRRVGRLRESALAMRRALDLDPQFALAMNGLGADESRSGNYDEAVIWYTRGLAFDPRYPPLSGNLAANYLTLGDDSAVERWSAFRDSVLGAGSLNPVYQDLQRGRVAAAGKQILAIIAANPSSAVAWLAAAEVAEAAGDWPAALRDTERLYALAPDLGTGGLRVARLHRALALLRARQPLPAAPLLQEEQRVAEEALASGADAPELFLRLAAVHGLRGEKEATLDWLQRAHVAGWNDFHALDTPFFALLQNDARLSALRSHMEQHVRAMRARVKALQAAGTLRTRP